MSGFFSPAAAKMSTTSSETTASETICRIAWFSSLVGLAARRARASAAPRAPPGRSRPRRGPRAPRRAGTASANAFDSSVTALQRAASLPVLLRQDVLLRRGQHARAAAAGVPVTHGDQSKPWNSRGRPRSFSSITRHRLVLVHRGRRPCRRLSVYVGERLLAAGRRGRGSRRPGRPACPEHAVHARDGLHQPVAAHRLVDVHRVQARRVEAGEPHVAHDHELERVGRVLEALWRAPRAAPWCGCAAASRAGRRPSRSSRP